MLDQQRDYVLRTVEERGVRLVRLWFTDVLGNLKSFAISPAELENALDDGMTFDGSSIDGFSRIQEADVLAVPDPDTFEIIPWGEPGAAEARVFCDIVSLDGTPFIGDPRQVLRRNTQAARDLGYTFYIAPDIEFFYFEPPKAGQQPQPLDQDGFFDLGTLDAAGDLRKQTIRNLEQLGIPVEYSFHEDSPSQQEIDLRHTDALDDGRQRDDVPARREGGRRRPRRARHVHAQAARGRAGLGHAPPHVAVPRRRERVLRRARPVPAVAARQVVHGRSAASRRRDHGDHEPDGQQLQAVDPRVRGAGPRRAGRATTAAG